MSKIKTIPIILVFVFIFLVVFFAIRAMNPAIYKYRISRTRTILSQIRSNINVYYENNRQYPVSLDLLKECVLNDENNIYFEGDWGEYISSPEKGNYEISSELNGQGGWYYNPETGEIHIYLNTVP